MIDDPLEPQPKPSGAELVKRIRGVVDLQATPHASPFSLLIIAIREYRIITGAALIDAKTWVEQHPDCYLIGQQQIDEAAAIMRRRQIAEQAVPMLKAVRALLATRDMQYNAEEPSHYVVGLNELDALYFLVEHLPEP